VCVFDFLGGGERESEREREREIERDREREREREAGGTAVLRHTTRASTSATFVVESSAHSER
jgi:hypothetical protein